MIIERRLFAVIPFVAIAVWLIDAAMDAYLFGRGGFLDVAFFHVPLQKIFIRWFFILFYSVFALFLPFISIAMTLGHAGKKVADSAVAHAAQSVAFGWPPIEAYLAGRKRKKEAMEKKEEKK
jgi:hypothetical protein